MLIRCQNNAVFPCPRHWKRFLIALYYPCLLHENFVNFINYFAQLVFYPSSPSYYRNATPYAPLNLFKHKLFCMPFFLSKLMKQCSFDRSKKHIKG